MSTIQTANLDELIAEARLLWHAEPVVHPDERERILIELIDLDLELERLTIRSRSEPLGAVDERALAHCADRLSKLRIHWELAS